LGTAFDTSPLNVGECLEGQAQVGRLEDDKGKIEEDEGHFGVVGTQAEGLGGIFVVGDVDSVEDGDNVDDDGHPGRRVVVAAMAVGSTVDGAGEGKGQDGESEDNHADKGGDHGVVHDRVVEVDEGAGALGGAEEPEAGGSVVIGVGVHRLPLLLKVGQVVGQPVVIHNMATGLGGAVGAGGVGEVLPLGGALADGGRESDGRALADVVVLAAGHRGLGRGHVVVRGRASRDGRTRKQV